MTGAPRRPAATARELLLAGLVAFAAALPFAGKAVHQDDWAYLATAPGYLAEPGTWLAQETLYQGKPITAAQGVLHGPVWLLLLAVGLRLGDGGVLLPHLFMAAFLALLAASAASLAARLRAPPVLAGLALALSPGPLVMAGSVMTDLPMTALFTAAVALAASGLERGSAARLVAAGLVGSAAALTRYYGLAVVPLLLAMPFLWGPLRARSFLPAGVAAAGVGAFILWSLRATGQVDSERAREMLLAAAEIDRSKCLLAAVAALGGGGVGYALAALSAPRRLVAALAADRVRAALAAAGLAGGFGLALLAAKVPPELRPEGASALLQAAAFLAGGLGLAAALSPWLRLAGGVTGWRARSGAAALVGLWLLGYLVAAWVAVPFGATRYALPAMPPFFLLAARCAAAWLPARGPRIAAAGCALAGLCAAAADFRAAEVHRTFAREVAQRRAPGGDLAGGDLWVWGELGFRYYLERLAGARPLPGDSDAPRPGDRVLKSSVCTATRDDGWSGTYALDRRLLLRMRSASLELARDPWPVRVHSMEAHAGFYHVDAGFLPLAFSTAPHDRLQVWTVGEQNPFLDGFDGARVESAAPERRDGGNVQVEPLFVRPDLEPRPAITFLHPGRATFSGVRVPERAELVALVGESARTWLEGAPGPPARLSISVDGVEVAAVVLDARREEAHRTWTELRADLAAFAGRDVEVALAVEAVGEPPADGSAPVVFTGFADLRILVRSP